jgi:hypothetical protein
MGPLRSEGLGKLPPPPRSGRHVKAYATPSLYNVKVCRVKFPTFLTVSGMSLQCLFKLYFSFIYLICTDLSHIVPRTPPPILPHVLIKQNTDYVKYRQKARFFSYCFILQCGSKTWSEKPEDYSNTAWKIQCIIHSTRGPLIGKHLKCTEPVCAQHLAQAGPHGDIRAP